MKLRLFAFGLLVTLILCGPLSLIALADDDDFDDEDEWTFTAAAAFESDYVWRGMTRHEGLSIQPEFTIAHDSGIWLDFWGAVDTSDDNDAEWDFEEARYSLGYDWNSCDWDFSLGGTFYTYPAIDEAEETSEIFAKVTYNYYPFSPYVGAYFDIDQAEGFYLYGGMSHTFPERNAPTVNAWLGYGDESHNEYYFGTDVDGPVDFNVDFSLTFNLNENWTLVPHVTATALPDEDVTGEIEDDFFVHGGIEALFTWD
jgi:hypothetical protein